LIHPASSSSTRTSSSYRVDSRDPERQAFARETMIRGTPAFKMIGGKVHMK